MFSFKKSPWLVSAFCFVMLIVIASCSLSIPNQPLISKNDNSINGNDNTPSSFPTPIITPTNINVSNGGYVAVSMYPDPSSPSGTKVYYTIDGSDPATSATAKEYTLPLAFKGNDATYELKAISRTSAEMSAQVTSRYWFGDWEIVGDIYPGYGTAGMSSAIFVDNNVPYISHKSATTPNALTIQKLVSGIWTAYPDVTSCNTWSGGNASSYLFVYNGVPYVACNATTGVYIKKYNSGWTTVGSLLPINDAQDVDLKIENGNIYLAGIDSVGHVFKIFKYDGSSWSQLGTSPGTGTRLCMSVKNNIPYITVNNSGLQIKKFDGTSWVNVGTLPSITISSGEAMALNIYDDGSADGIPYIAYIDGSGLQVKKYEGGAWLNVGGIIGSGGHDLNINIHNGNPYVSYNDWISEKAEVRRYFAGTWSDVGTSSFYQVDYTDSFIANDGTVYVYYAVISEGIGIVESFGPNGSGVAAHSEDPLGTLI